eukprot:scaffold36844_cov42-Cyclotella_meneghiniana.AAC.11
MEGKVMGHHHPRVTDDGVVIIVVLGITYQIAHLQRSSMPGPGIAEAGGQIGASSSVVRASEFAGDYL